MDIKEKILINKHYLLLDCHEEEISEKDRAYLVAFLLANYGIEITNKELVNRSILRQIDELFSLNVPSSFYENPQDTAYFTMEEYLVEQVVSYILGYGTSTKRVELFHKAFPQYLVGDEIVFRTYTIINEKEAEEILQEHTKSLCSYRRPFSLSEIDEFTYLVENGYYHDEVIACRDNIFILLKINPEYAKRLDYKDVVKLSINAFGDHDKNLKEVISRHKDIEALFVKILPLVRPCPLSKRQAKYFNKLIRIFNAPIAKVDNNESPYKKIKELMEKDPYLCAEELSKDGSLLSRNIRYILSRCSFNDTEDIIDCMKDDNPIVLYQIYSTIIADEYRSPRIFTFSRDNTSISHLETEDEKNFRKSTLDKKKTEMLLTALKEKLNSHYDKTPRLGKIYIDEEYRKVALPVNTSASGSGIDVLPSGSRIKFDADFLRTFVYWNGIYDIDASLLVIDEEYFKDPKNSPLYVFNWTNAYSKPFGEDVLCSGDDTSNNGAEYQDININGLINRGYRYAISICNGFNSPLNVGTVRAGLQIKNNLKTKAWDSKNISFQMDIKGDTRCFTNFAVDLLNREIIIINLKTTGDRVASMRQVLATKKYLNDAYLNYSMYDVLSHRGEVIDNIEEAEIVFSRDYTPKENQKVIRPYDIAALVEIINQ